MAGQENKMRDPQSEALTLPGSAGAKGVLVRLNKANVALYKGALFGRVLVSKVVPHHAHRSAAGLPCPSVPAPRGQC